MSQSSFKHAEYFGEDGVNPNRVKPNYSGPVVYQKHKSFSYTGGIDLHTVDKIILPGNMLGPNGSMRFHAHFQSNNNANSKSFGVYINGLAMYTSSSTASLNNYMNFNLKNRGVVNQQLMGVIGASGTSGLAGNIKTIDTSQDMLVEFKINLTDAGDTGSIESWIIEMIPG
jgi:hypothetical protein